MGITVITITATTLTTIIITIIILIIIIIIINIIIITIILIIIIIIIIIIVVVIITTTTTTTIVIIIIIIIYSIISLWVSSALKELLIAFSIRSILRLLYRDVDGLIFTITHSMASLISSPISSQAPLFVTFCAHLCRDAFIRTLPSPLSLPLSSSSSSSPS